MSKKGRWLLLFPLVWVLAACSGNPAPSSHPADAAGTATPFLNTLPAEKGLVFIGAAAKRSNANETLRLALEDAARRISAYHRVYGEYAVEHNAGSGAFDYAHNTQMFLSYDVAELKKYTDALKFNADTDILEMDNTLIVRTTYPATLPVPVKYRPAYGKTDQKPSWVDNPPSEIAGYEVGVGYSGRYSSLADTCTNSFHNAVFAIIRNINSAGQSSTFQYQNSGSLFGYKTSSDNSTYSYGMLAHFYILDMWIDPKDKSVWTLAIARKYGG